MLPVWASSRLGSLSILVISQNFSQKSTSFPYFEQVCLLNVSVYLVSQRMHQALQLCLERSWSTMSAAESELIGLFVAWCNKSQLLIIRWGATQIYKVTWRVLYQLVWGCVPTCVRVYQLMWDWAFLDTGIASSIRGKLIDAHHNQASAILPTHIQSQVVCRLYLRLWIEYCRNLLPLQFQ